MENDKNQIASFFEKYPNGKFKTNFSLEKIKEMSTNKFFNKTKLEICLSSEEGKGIGEFSIPFGEIDNILMRENLKEKREPVFYFNIEGYRITLDWIEKKLEHATKGRFSIQILSVFLLSIF